MKHRIFTSILLAAAFVAPAANATIIGYWRFESPAPLADSSGNGRTLTAQGNATAVLLPGSGNGSAFPDPIPFSMEANASAATFDGTTDRFTTPDSSAFTDSTISLETFLSAPSLNGSNKGLAGHWTATGNQRSYLFAVGTSNRLAFLFSTLGTDTVTVTSTLPVLLPNTDYYAAVTVDLSDTSANGITFYLQDLTNGGPLLSDGVAHAATTLFNSSTSFAIGATNQPSSEYTGLIDEVRLSDTKLTASELLITAIPEPSSMLLGLGAAIGMLGFRQRRQRV